VTQAMKKITGGRLQSGKERADEFLPLTSRKGQEGGYTLLMEFDWVLPKQCHNHTFGIRLRLQTTTANNKSSTRYLMKRHITRCHVKARIIKTNTPISPCKHNVSRYIPNLNFDTFIVLGPLSGDTDRTRLFWDSTWAAEE